MAAAAEPLHSNGGGLLQLYPYPVPVQHSRPSGAPFSPSSQFTKNKEDRETRKVTFCPPRVGASHSLPLTPVAPLQLLKGVSSGVEGGAAPRTLRGGAGDIHPNFGLSLLPAWHGRDLARRRV